MEFIKIIIPAQLPQPVILLSVKIGVKTNCCLVVDILVADLLLISV